jgi:hypothetical protein
MSSPQSTANTTNPISGEFKKIRKYREQIQSILRDLRTRKKTLHTIHTELLRLNHSKLFVFGLDSLQFQQQLIEIECENMDRIYRVQSNRMYGDFFKLHQQLESYIQDNPNTVSILNDSGQVYPPYRVIEIYQEFEFRYTVRLFKDIMKLIQGLEGYIEGLTAKLQSYKKQQEIGLNIDNFIFAFQNCKDDMVNKVDLFKKYLQYFTKLHVNYLHRFVERLTMSYKQVTNDIRFEQERLGTTVQDITVIPGEPDIFATMEGGDGMEDSDESDKSDESDESGEL